MFVLAAPSLPFSFTKLWEAERSERGLKNETLASLMGLTRPQLAQQLNERGHVSFQRFLMLLADPDGREFAQGLLNRIFSEVGLAHVDPFSTWLKHGMALMLKAHLRKKDDDERNIA